MRWCGGRPHDPPTGVATRTVGRAHAQEAAGKRERGGEEGDCNIDLVFRSCAHMALSALRARRADELEADCVQLVGTIAGLARPTPHTCTSAHAMWSPITLCKVVALGT